MSQMRLVWVGVLQPLILGQQDPERMDLQEFRTIILFYLLLSHPPSVTGSFIPPLFLALQIPLTPLQLLHAQKRTKMLQIIRAFLQFRSSISTYCLAEDSGASGLKKGPQLTAALGSLKKTNQKPKTNPKCGAHQRCAISGCHLGFPSSFMTIY